MEKDNGEKITSLILKGENMENLIYLAPIAGIIAVIFAGIKAAMINKSDAGNEKMKEISGANIKSKPEWSLAGIYADEAITGTQVKKREDFQRLINDCMNGDVDMVITKSISRFARNTLDTLKICSDAQR